MKRMTPFNQSKCADLKASIDFTAQSNDYNWVEIITNRLCWMWVQWIIKDIGRGMDIRAIFVNGQSKKKIE